MRCRRVLFASLWAALSIAVSDRAALGQAVAVTSDGPAATVPPDVNLAPVVPLPDAAPIYSAQVMPQPYAGPPQVGMEYPAPMQPPAIIGQPAVGGLQENELQTDVHFSHWYFDSTVVALGRDNASRLQSIYPNLSTHSPQFDGVAAPRLTLGYSIDPHNSVQLVYLGAFDMEGTASSEGPFTINSMTVDGLTKIDYTSNLQSVEANFIHTWNCWSILGGFRYVHLDEQFDVVNSSLNPIVMFRREFNMDTANDLFGGQIGWNWHYEWPWLMLDIGGQCGVFGNAAVQHGLITMNGATMARGANDPSIVSDVGELDFSIGHRITPHCIIHAGLTTLWIDNVALAPDYTISNTPNGNVTVAGFELGLAAQW